MIRIGNQIFTEQKEIDDQSNIIREPAIYRAIEKFCTHRATELVRQDKVLREIKRIRQVDFTIPYLSNQIFKEVQNSTRNRMMVWREEAAIIEIERIVEHHSKQKRPVKLFGIKDIRIAKEMFPELHVSEFLDSKYRRCPQCEAIVLRDWGDLDSSTTCQDCQFNLLNQETDSHDVWKYQAAANASRRHYREETAKLEQLDLFDF